MKVIYVFNDSRPSDRQHAIVALADDGKPAAVTHFDDWTLPYAQFALCCVDECDATGSDSHLVAETRANAFAGFNRRYGEGQWTAVWIENPRRDPGCVDALRVLPLFVNNQNLIWLRLSYDFGRMSRYKYIWTKISEKCQ